MPDLTVFWELRHTDPVIDFRLLRTRNFAVANFFYFLFWVGLFASTTLIPQFSHHYMGIGRLMPGWF